jgi:hypothetical protein
VCAGARILEHDEILEELLTAMDHSAAR